MDVLIIEHDDRDARRIEEALGRGAAATGARVVRVTRLGEGMDLLDRRQFDAVVVDLSLPDSGTGRDTFARFHGYLRTVPVVIVTAMADPDVAAMAMRAGAHDYVVKEGLATYPLGRAVARAVERFRTAAALRHSQERYRQLFEALPTPCFAFDEQTLAILAVNEAAVRLYGWTREELLGMTLTEIRPPEEVPGFLHVRAAWSEEVDGDDDEGASYPMRRHRAKDGRDIYVDVTCRPFRLDGRAVRIALVTDVTERKRAEAAEAERAALRETVAAMEQVLGVVGHELRTPLAGLRAISELVLGRDVSVGAEARPLLRCLHDEVVRMSDTVDTLLEAARLNSGRATWNWSRFGVGRVCLEAIDGLRPLMAPADGAAVSLQVDVDPSTEMLGDAAAVRRLLVNLLSNAHKHTARGFVRVSVHEERDADGGSWVRVRVADTGTGIPPDVLARLGQAFSLNSGVVGIGHVGGTGLGLAICQGIVDAHGGSMSVDSIIGAGTTVTVRLRSDLAGPVAAAMPRPSGPGESRAA